MPRFLAKSSFLLIEFDWVSSHKNTKKIRTLNEKVNPICLHGTHILYVDMEQICRSNSFFGTILVHNTHIHTR